MIGRQWWLLRGLQSSEAMHHIYRQVNECSCSASTLYLAKLERTLHLKSGQRDFRAPRPTKPALWSSKLLGWCCSAGCVYISWRSLCKVEIGSEHRRINKCLGLLAVSHWKAEHVAIPRPCFTWPFATCWEVVHQIPPKLAGQRLGGKCVTWIASSVSIEACSSNVL